VSAPPTLPVTHRTSVTDDQIDHLGHMNVRFYGVAARAATKAVARHLAGVDDGASLTIEVPDAYTRHLREQMLGAQLFVRSGVLDTAPGALRLYHELVNEESGDLAASFVHQARVSGPDGADVAWRDDEELTLEQIPERGRPRSIDLDVAWDGDGPALEELVERDLAMRLPREVLPGEVGTDGRVQPGEAPMLVWGGVPIEPGTGPVLAPGPNGELIGWASMENRLCIGRLPAAGDRIQSFSAVLSVADKVVHRIAWAFDLDTKALLCAFEVVDLAFDTVSRRAVPIPAEQRASALAKLYEDLRPGRG
jgi:acyl-CoA thioester hydrolase